MSGLLDTNIVVRYLTYDPPHQAEKAAAIIEEDDDLSVTGVVIAEVAYVLRQEYGLRREAVVDQLLRFLRLENIIILGFDKHVVLQALLLCRPSGRVSIADALTWAAALGTEHRVVCTFDQRFPSNGITLKSERS
jgi:predicted nucleic acid-binding protein